jgi:hypothetical protein
MKRRLPDRLCGTLLMYFGACPHCQSSDGWQVGNNNGSTAHIYRSSSRSVTMRCSQCGLHWTMTAHQMAKVAPGTIEKLEAAEDFPGKSSDIASLRVLMTWAGDVGDIRGRRAAPA